MKNNLLEVLTTLGIILIAILLLNPFEFWMPDMMVMGMLVLALMLFGIFASFVLREKITDERDAVHETLAGRNAFLVGSAVLILGIVVEGYTHTVDPWLVGALVFMITAKIVTRIWSDRNL